MRSCVYSVISLEEMSGEVFLALGVVEGKTPLVVKVQKYHIKIHFKSKRGLRRSPVFVSKHTVVAPSLVLVLTRTVSCNVSLLALSIMPFSGGGVTLETSYVLLKQQ